MRRKDREETDITEIEKILLQCKTCHVAMVEYGVPYVVPLSYGYRIFNGNLLELYFHSALEGKKLNILRKNNSVCFEITYEGQPIHANTPCKFGLYFVQSPPPTTRRASSPVLVCVLQHRLCAILSV